MIKTRTIEEIRSEFDTKQKALYKKAINLTREERRKQVEELVTWYKEETGMNPDSYRLSKLANIILVEEIRDRNPYKAKKTEYSFHSPRQEKTRATKEVFVEDDSTLDFFHQKHNKRIDSAFKKRTQNREE